MRIILIIALVFVSFSVHAETVGEVTELPVPRFVSMRSDRVYARTGPGTRYPIKWVYQRNDLPVEIVQEFDTWRKIRDKDGEEGWVHQSLLSGKRTAIVNTGQAVPLLRKASDDSRPVALLESGALVYLESCKKNWCEAATSGFNGWIPSTSLWGVYEGETFE